MKNIIPVITIDGPSGSGKGTISHLLAKKLAWHFLDSGAIYRVLAYAVTQKNIDLDDVAAIEAVAKDLDLRFKINEEQGKTQILLADEDVTEKIRGEENGIVASKIAVHPPVRAALLQKHDK